MTTPKNNLLFKVGTVSSSLLACAALVALAWSTLATPDIRRQVDIVIQSEVEPWVKTIDAKQNRNDVDHDAIIKKLDRMEKMQLILMTDDQRKKVRFLLER